MQVTHEQITQTRFLSSCDLELDPMTSIEELEDVPGYKKNCLDQGFQKLEVRALQADRRTDKTEHITTTQFSG